MARKSDHEASATVAPTSSPLDDGANKLPEHKSREFAYMVATRAWKDGMTANAITRDLFDDSSPLHLMQVKRALKRAHDFSFLKFVPPESIRWFEKLDAVVNPLASQKKIRLHVVEDSDRTAGAPVYAKAAELIADFIDEAAGRPPEQSPGKRVVICNAGGRTVSETVKALVRNPPVLDRPADELKRFRDSLMFVGANAACQPDRFSQSSSFLSVSMAELFEAKHWAVTTAEDAETAHKHDEFVASTSLFLCGAGTCKTRKKPAEGDQADKVKKDDSALSLMTQQFHKRGWTMPPNAEGDLGFNLLDKNGAEVELPHDDARKYMKQLNPSLTLTRLLRIASHGRVVVVLDAEDPTDKTLIGTAVLKGRFATDVVLGTRLANAIVDGWHPTN